MEKRQRLYICRDERCPDSKRGSPCMVIVTDTDGEINVPDNGMCIFIRERDTQRWERLGED